MLNRVALSALVCVGLVVFSSCVLAAVPAAASAAASAASAAESRVGLGPDSALNLAGYFLCARVRVC